MLIGKFWSNLGWGWATGLISNSEKRTMTTSIHQRSARSKVPSSVKGKGTRCFTKMESAEEMERICPPEYSKEHKVGIFNFLQWIVARNGRSSLGENIDVDILSRPVDKDSNCTELCHVLALFVVPLIIPSVVPSALFGANKNCAINVQVLNPALIQNSTGFATCTWYTCFNYCFIVHVRYASIKKRWTFLETISIAVLLCHYKCSSGRSISEAAPHFWNLCVYEPSTLRRKPSNSRKKTSDLWCSSTANAY